MAIALDAMPGLYLALLLYNLTQAATMEVLGRLHIRSAYRDLSLEVRRLADSVDRLKDNTARPSDVVAVLDEIKRRSALRVARGLRRLARAPTTGQLSASLAACATVLNGDDLRSMGIPPGRVYRRILEALRAARLDGAVSSRADEETLARQISARPDDVPGE